MSFDSDIIVAIIIGFGCAGIVWPHVKEWKEKRAAAEEDNG